MTASDTIDRVARATHLSKETVALALTALRPGDELPNGLDVQQGWRPIGTAPKDGTPVLLWFAEISRLDALRIGWYRKAGHNLGPLGTSGWWCWSANRRFHGEPIAWRPFFEVPAMLLASRPAEKEADGE